MTKITTTIWREGGKAGKHWAKHVTRIDPSKTNGYAFLGDWVDMDRSVQLPVGAVVLCFDGVNEKTKFRATIRVFQATERGVAEIERLETSDRGWALTVRPIIEGLLGPVEVLYRVTLTAEERHVLSRAAEYAEQHLFVNQPGTLASERELAESSALVLAQEALADAEEVR